MLNLTVNNNTFILDGCPEQLSPLDIIENDF